MSTPALAVSTIVLGDFLERGLHMLGGDRLGFADRRAYGRGGFVVRHIALAQHLLRLESGEVECRKPIRSVFCNVTRGDHGHLQVAPNPPC